MRAPRSLQGKILFTAASPILIANIRQPTQRPRPANSSGREPTRPWVSAEMSRLREPTPNCHRSRPSYPAPHGPRSGGHWNSFSPDRWRHSGCPSSCIRRPWRSGTGAYKARPSSPWPSSPSWPALGICVYHPCGNHTGGSQNNHFFLYHTSSEFLASVRFRQTHVMTNRGPRNGLEYTVGVWERDARASRYGNIPIWAVTSVVKAQSMRFTNMEKMAGR